MKYIFALPLILFPYTLLLGLYCLYSGFLMESVFGNNGYLLLFVLFLCAVAAFCFTLPLSFRLRKGRTAGAWLC